MNVQHVTLDLSKAPTYAQIVAIGQGDAGGTTIVADVYDNGQAVSLSGMSATFCMRLPSNGGYVRDSGCTVSGSQITYVVDESKCASVSGRAECYFEIKSGSTKYSTARFPVIVKRAANSGTEAARTWDADYDEWEQSKETQFDADYATWKQQKTTQIDTDINAAKNEVLASLSELTSSEMSEIIAALVPAEEDQS